MCVLYIYSLSLLFPVCVLVAREKSRVEDVVDCVVSPGCISFSAAAAPLPSLYFLRFSLSLISNTITPFSPCLYILGIYKPYVCQQQPLYPFCHGRPRTFFSPFADVWPLTCFCCSGLLLLLLLLFLRRPQKILLPCCFVVFI